MIKCERCGQYSLFRVRESGLCVPCDTVKNLDAKNLVKTKEGVSATIEITKTIAEAAFDFGQKNPLTTFQTFWENRQKLVDEFIDNHNNQPRRN